jgi:hypothetical protein
MSVRTVTPSSFPMRELSSWAGAGNAVRANATADDQISDRIIFLPIYLLAEKLFLIFVSTHQPVRIVNNFLQQRPDE